MRDDSRAEGPERDERARALGADGSALLPAGGGDVPAGGTSTRSMPTEGTASRRNDGSLPSSTRVPSGTAATDGDCTAPADDALSQVLAQAEMLSRDGAAREVVASIITGVLAAVEAPVAMRDALTDTEPGSVAEALGVVGVIDQLRSTLAALDATWQVMAATRIADADAMRGVPTADQGLSLIHI